MNNRQIINPDINPSINGERGVNPLIAKLRRKLGLTYIVDNPFPVPVAQSASAKDADSANKTKKPPL